jgi:hypothetical protein
MTETLTFQERVIAIQAVWQVQVQKPRGYTGIIKAIIG